MWNHSKCRTSLTEINRFCIFWASNKEKCFCRKLKILHNNWHLRPLHVYLLLKSYILYSHLHIPPDYHIFHWLRIHLPFRRTHQSLQSIPVAVPANQRFSLMISTHGTTDPWHLIWSPCRIHKAWLLWPDHLRYPSSCHRTCLGWPLCHPNILPCYHFGCWEYLYILSIHLQNKNMFFYDADTSRKTVQNIKPINRVLHTFKTWEIRPGLSFASFSVIQRSSVTITSLTGQNRITFIVMHPDLLSMWQVRNKNIQRFFIFWRKRVS